MDAELREKRREKKFNIEFQTKAILVRPYEKFKEILKRDNAKSHLRFKCDMSQSISQGRISSFEENIPICVNIFFDWPKKIFMSDKVHLPMTRECIWLVSRWMIGWRSTIVSVLKFLPSLYLSTSNVCLTFLNISSNCLLWFSQIRFNCLNTIFATFGEAKGHSSNLD